MTGTLTPSLWTVPLVMKTRGALSLWLGSGGQFLGLLIGFFSCVSSYSTGKDIIHLKAIAAAKSVLPS